MSHYWSSQKSPDSLDGNDKLIAQQSGIQYDTMMGQASDGSVKFGKRHQSEYDALLITKLEDSNSMQNILFVASKTKQRRSNTDSRHTEEWIEVEDAGNYALRPVTEILMMETVKQQ